MKYRSVDLLVIAAITIVAATSVFVVSPDNVPGRILTLPLVLVLPGYALTSAVFTSRSLEALERLLFSLGFSLVIVIMGGLALNWTPFGLHPNSWSVLLSGITLAASAVALIRRRAQNAFIPRWLRMTDIHLSFRQGLLLGLAGVVISAAVAVSIIGAARQPYPAFTQLWILQADGANLKNTVQLGVSNMDSTAMEYNLDVSVDGKIVKGWLAIDLKPNEKWETTLILPQITHAGAAKVEAVLYRANASTKIYRHVVLWLGT